MEPWAPCSTGLCRAAALALRYAQCLGGRQAPLNELLRVHPLGSAPGTALLLVQRGRRQQRLEARCRGPLLLACGLQQRRIAPLLQCLDAHTELRCDVCKRRALRRQQPRHRFVLECLSVSGQLVLPSTPQVQSSMGATSILTRGGILLSKPHEHFSPQLHHTLTMEN